MLIKELDVIRKQKKRLQLEEAKLSAPLLRKTELIHVIYRWFNEIHQERNSSSIVTANLLKKQFLFIVMYLYSPVFLVGGKMEKGVRGVLAEVLQYESRSSISSLCADVWILYCNYRTFRESVDEVYLIIIDRLKKKRLIDGALSQIDS